MNQSHEKINIHLLTKNIKITLKNEKIFTYPCCPCISSKCCVL